jgi:hypothetical protein
MSELKIAPPERFELSLGERQSPLWLRLKRHLEEQLARARATNDAPNLTEAQTAALRGEIAAIKKLLKLDRED